MHEMLKQATAIADEIVAHRRYFHQNPEVGAHLPGTTKYIIEKLTEMGYTPTEICDSGVVATIGKPGKVFMLRADTDALPMKETSGLPFASPYEDAAHTCGHDTHAAMLLGAAKLLKQNEDKLEGTVKLMFQPNEEGLKGAEAMINAGLLENPKVDAAMGIHISSQTPSGEIHWSDGPCGASGDKFLIEITGKGGHGSAPEKCIDPIHVACHIFLGLEGLIAREVGAKDTAVITVGHIWGGEKENIIPSTAGMTGTIRAYTHETRAMLKQRLEEVSMGIAATYRCECKVSFPFGVAPNVNNPEVQKEVLSYVSDLIGPEKVVEEEAGMGSEDFAMVAEQVPAMFLRLGAMWPDESKVVSHHHSAILFNEEAFPVGSAAYAHVAIEWLKNHK